MLNDRVVTVARLLQDAEYHSYMAGKCTWALKRCRALRTKVLSAAGGWEGVAPHYSSDRRFLPTTISMALNRLKRASISSLQMPTSRLIEFIDRNRHSGRPFFGYLALPPHSPLQAPKELVGKYEPIYARSWDVIRAERYRRLQNGGLAGGAGAATALAGGARLGFSRQTKRAFEARKMALYAGLIDNMDQNIGRLLTRLRDIGEYENTVVLLSTMARNMSIQKCWTLS